jgi:phosphoserine phosphatase
MKKTKVIYWASTGALCFIMIFSMFKMYTPIYEHLGFPHYFRTELLIAKMLGLVVLLAPRIPSILKEWAYAGFTIVLISASVAHFSSGDTVINAIEPYIWLIILMVSNRYFHKLNTVQDKQII